MEKGEIFEVGLTHTYSVSQQVSKKDQLIHFSRNRGKAAAMPALPGTTPLWSLKVQKVCGPYFLKV